MPPDAMDAESQPGQPKPGLDHQALEDAQDLADLGHAPELSRKFDIWSMLALTFCVLGTWSTFAQGLSSGLANGGPVAILWGLVLVTFCNVCVALSLGELCSAMPTALGQAYWVSRLSQCAADVQEGGGGTPSWKLEMGRFASYLCAWINTFGWWTLSASQIAFMADFLLGMEVLFDNNWTGAGTGWVELLVYVGVTLLLTVINLVSCRKDKLLPWFNDFVAVWFVSLFFVLSLALLVSVGTKPDLSFQPASFVFGRWINQSGWNDGVTWFLGLIQAAYGLTAFDSAIHMVEEIPAPRTNVPRAIWLSVVCGAATGFLFMVVCLFCIQSLDDILDPVTGLPFMDLVSSTVGLRGGAVLLALFIFNGLGQGVSILTTASRLTWGFARDGGLPFSAYFSHVDETWRVPARAMWLQGAIVALVGVLYTFATTALDAILSVSTIALTVSYGMPIATLLLVGRDRLPPGPFRLGRVVGPCVNGVSLVYCAITTVFFFFPSAPHPAPADMNYAIAVFGIMLVVAVAFWFIGGRAAYFQAESPDVIVAERHEQPEALDYVDVVNRGPKKAGASASS